MRSTLAGSSAAVAGAKAPRAVHQQRESVELAQAHSAGNGREAEYRRRPGDLHAATAQRRAQIVNAAGAQLVAADDVLQPGWLRCRSDCGIAAGNSPCRGTVDRPLRQRGAPAGQTGFARGSGAPAVHQRVFPEQKRNGCGHAADKQAAEVSTAAREPPGFPAARRAPVPARTRRPLRAAAGERPDGRRRSAARLRPPHVALNGRATDAHLGPRGGDDAATVRPAGRWCARHHWSPSAPAARMSVLPRPARPDRQASRCSTSLSPADPAAGRVDGVRLPSSASSCRRWTRPPGRCHDRGGRTRRGSGWP